jgi:predicted nucleic acid-binding protein
MKKTSVYDTRFFVEYFFSEDEKTRKELKNDAQETREKMVSTATIHEFYGLNLRKAGREAARLRCDSIAKEFKVINIDYECAILSAEIRNKAPIPFADSVIAATALSLGCPIVSDDKHFKEVQGLKTRWPIS